MSAYDVSQYVRKCAKTERPEYLVFCQSSRFVVRFSYHFDITSLLGSLCQTTSTKTLLNQRDKNSVQANHSNRLLTYTILHSSSKMMGLLMLDSSSIIVENVDCNPFSWIHIHPILQFSFCQLPSLGLQGMPSILAVFPPCLSYQNRIVICKVQWSLSFSILEPSI